MKYPFQPEVLDALPEELAELFRALEDTLLDEICSRLKLADQLNEVTVQDIRALRSHGIDLKEIKKAIRETFGISKTKLDKLLGDVVARNQQYYMAILLTQPRFLMPTAIHTTTSPPMTRHHTHLPMPSTVFVASAPS